MLCFHLKLAQPRAGPSSVWYGYPNIGVTSKKVDFEFQILEQSKKVDFLESRLVAVHAKMFVGQFEKITLVLRPFLNWCSCKKSEQAKKFKTHSLKTKIILCVPCDNQIVLIIINLALNHSLCSFAPPSDKFDNPNL